MNLLRKCLARFWKVIDYVMVVAMIVMIILVFVNAVLRYGFNSGILVSAEISRYLFVWVILLGAVASLRDHEHLELRVIDKILPARARWVLRRLVYLVIIGSSFMLFLGSLRQTISNWSNYSPMSGIPVGMMYLAGTISGILMAAIAVYFFFVPGSDEREQE